MDLLRQLHEDVHMMGSLSPRPATSGESHEGLKSAGTRVETEVTLQPHGAFSEGKRRRSFFQVAV